MKLYNLHTSPLGIPVKGSIKSTVIPVGGMAEGDFDMDNAVLAVWLKEGVLSKTKPAGFGAAERIPTPDNPGEPTHTYSAAHKAFGDFVVVDETGAVYKDDEGKDLVFKAVDGDAKYKAETKAGELNAKR